MLFPTGLHIAHGYVVTCEEAARARGIPLEQELKTLLLMIGHWRVAVHIQGSDRLCRQPLRRLFRTHDIRFINRNELRAMGLERGIINPWNVPKSIVHVVCRRTLAHEVMGTNAGTFCDGILFAPFALLELQNLILGDIGCN